MPTPVAHCHGTVAGYAYCHADAVRSPALDDLLAGHADKPCYVASDSFAAHAVTALHQHEGGRPDLGVLSGPAYGAGSLHALIHHCEQARAAEATVACGAVVLGGGSWGTAAPALSSSNLPVSGNDDIAGISGRLHASGAGLRACRRAAGRAGPRHNGGRQRLEAAAATAGRHASVRCAGPAAGTACSPASGAGCYHRELWLSAALERFQLCPDVWIAHSFGANTVLTLLARHAAHPGPPRPRADLAVLQGYAPGRSPGPLFRQHVNEFLTLSNQSIRARTARAGAGCPAAHDARA